MFLCVQYILEYHLLSSDDQSTASVSGNFDYVISTHKENPIHVTSTSCFYVHTGITSLILYPN